MKSLTPGDRLLSFIENDIKTNRNAFGESVGLSKKMIYNYINGDTKLTMDNLKRITEKYDELNPLWILSGDEPRLLKPSKGLRLQLEDKDIIIQKLEHDLDTATTEYHSNLIMQEKQAKFIEQLQVHISNLLADLERKQKEIDELRKIVDKR